MCVCTCVCVCVCAYNLPVSSNSFPISSKAARLIILLEYAFEVMSYNDECASHAVINFSSR